MYFISPEVFKHLFNQTKTVQPTTTTPPPPTQPTTTTQPKTTTQPTTTNASTIYSTLSFNNWALSSIAGIAHGMISVLPQAILDIRAHQGKKESKTSRFFIHSLGAVAGTAVTSVINHSLTEMAGTNDEDENLYNQVLLNIGVSLSLNFGLQFFNCVFNCIYDKFPKNKPLVAVKAVAQNVPAVGLLSYNRVISFPDLVCVSSSLISGSLLSGLIYQSLASTENTTTDPETAVPLTELAKPKDQVDTSRVSISSSPNLFKMKSFSYYCAPEQEEENTNKKVIAGCSSGSGYAP